MRAPTPEAPVTIAATSTTIVGRDDGRTHLIIQADETNTEPVYLGYTAAAVLNTGVAIYPGQARQYGPSAHCILKITGICASGGQKVNVEVS
jgi:hypothetical protein